MLRAGDRCAEIGIGIPYLDNGGVVAVDLDDGRVSSASSSEDVAAGSMIAGGELVEVAVEDVLEAFAGCRHPR